MKKEKEIWKTVDLDDRYEVSSFGRIRRFYASSGYKYLKPQLTGKGYLKVRLSNKSCRLHRLVAFAFVDGYSEVNNCVNHKNGIKTDNNANNLEWVSVHGNNYHAIVNGLSTHKPVVVFDKKGNKIAQFESKSMAFRFGFSEKYQMDPSVYTKEKALERLNRPRKKPVHKVPRNVGDNDFNALCDPELKQRVLFDLNNGKSIKDIISEYGLSYYKVSLLKGTPYMRDK